eukprot:GFYU01042449.1.p2 GENE.GFYU01042449.1~~GFYU01042449.1.p2  ORF type:complete len:138 (+),score=23.71 GFYU01042449.1:200-613(+)
MLTRVLLPLCALCLSSQCYWITMCEDLKSCPSIYTVIQVIYTFLVGVIAGSAGEETKSALACLLVLYLGQLVVYVWLKPFCDWKVTVSEVWGTCSELMTVALLLGGLEADSSVLNDTDQVQSIVFRGDILRIPGGLC